MNVYRFISNFDFEVIRPLFVPKTNLYLTDKKAAIKLVKTATVEFGKNLYPLQALLKSISNHGRLAPVDGRTMAFTSSYNLIYHNIDNLGRSDSSYKLTLLGEHFLAELDFWIAKNQKITAP